MLVSRYSVYSHHPQFLQSGISEFACSSSMSVFCKSYKCSRVRQLFIHQYNISMRTSLPCQLKPQLFSRMKTFKEPQYFKDNRIYKCDQCKHHCDLILTPPVFISGRFCWAFHRFHNCICRSSKKSNNSKVDQNSKTNNSPAKHRDSW